jgi:hypothetical protein
VGIPDEDTWIYSETLMKIVVERGFSDNIKILRVMDILGLSKGQMMTKELYLTLVNQSRIILLQRYARTEAEVRCMIKSDNDTLSTYCGFIRFLEEDLR